MLNLEHLTPWKHTVLGIDNVRYLRAKTPDDATYIKHEFIVRLTVFKTEPPDALLARVITDNMKEVMEKENVPVDEIDTIVTIIPVGINWYRNPETNNKIGPLCIKFWAKSGDTWYGSEHSDPLVAEFKKQLVDVMGD